MIRNAPLTVKNLLYFGTLEEITKSRKGETADARLLWAASRLEQCALVEVAEYLFRRGAQILSDWRKWHLEESQFVNTIKLRHRRGVPKGRNYNPENWKMAPPEIYWWGVISSL